MAYCKRKNMPLTVACRARRNVSVRHAQHLTVRTFVRTFALSYEKLRQCLGRKCLKRLRSVTRLNTEFRLLTERLQVRVLPESQSAYNQQDRPTLLQ